MGFTSKELSRAKRFAKGWYERKGPEGELKNPRLREQFDRALATEFGRIRRGLIQRLKKEIERMHFESLYETETECMSQAGNEQKGKE